MLHAASLGLAAKGGTHDVENPIMRFLLFSHDVIFETANVLHLQMLNVFQERNSYRVQLDLYEKDLTVSQSQQSQQAQNRISELEQFLQGYRELVDRLEADLSAMSGAGGQGALAEQLQAARKRQLELESERDELIARCDNLELQMEHRALKGDFNPGATRILHYK